MKSKKRLSYITIAAIFVLTSIFVGMHMTGVKDSSAHTQLIISQKQSPKHSEFILGRDRGKIYQVMKTMLGGIQKETQRHMDLAAAQKDSGLLLPVFPRGPPNTF